MLAVRPARVRTRAEELRDDGGAAPLLLELRRARADEAVEGLPRGEVQRAAPVLVPRRRVGLGNSLSLSAKRLQKRPPLRTLA